MSLIMLRAKVKPEHVDDVETAVGRVFAALDREQPEGIAYLSTRGADGQTFTVQLKLDDGVENPLPAYPEFQAFQTGLRTWLLEPPTPEPMTVVGSYRAL